MTLRGFAWGIMLVALAMFWAAVLGLPVLRAAVYTAGAFAAFAGLARLTLSSKTARRTTAPISTAEHRLDRNEPHRRRRRQQIGDTLIGVGLVFAGDAEHKAMPERAVA